MAELARGLYRIGGWVYVTDDTVQFDLREADYRARGYKPYLNQLPSKRDYDIAEAAKKKAAEKAEKDGNA